MDREKVQLDKTDKLQIRVNELTAQNATLVEQLHQLKQLQGAQEGRKQNQRGSDMPKKETVKYFM